MKYAILIWVLEAFFGHTAHLEFKSKWSVTHGLWPVNGQLCVLQSNEQANSLEGWARDPHTNESPSFLVRRRNTSPYNYEGLEYQQVFEYMQTSQHQPFQEYAQLLVKRNISGIFLFF